MCLSFGIDVRGTISVLVDLRKQSYLLGKQAQILNLCDQLGYMSGLNLILSGGISELMKLV